MSADKMIGQISVLLRSVLEDQHADLVPLSKEIDLLKAYTGIEKTRFGDRMMFDYHVDQECLPAMVPPMLLQPLLENAVRHGLEPMDKNGHIWFRARKQDQSLLIQIEDDGVGRDQHSVPGWGIGLSNAKARLDALFENEYRLELKDREGEGTAVIIEIPFKEKP